MATTEYDGNLTASDPTLVKQYRDQVLALGVLWVILGALATAVCVISIKGSEATLSELPGAQRAAIIITGVMGVTWIILGVLTCMKRMGAVYVGLVLSYLSLLGNLMVVNVIAIVILVVVILQAHRVIGWAKRMGNSGVPSPA